MRTEKHPLKKWEVSIIEIHDTGNIIYKVTRRLAEMEVAETKLFASKEDAKQQFEEWLN
ncbi:MAG TPA: hypothetical protein VJI15_02730 [Candidatus Nanoarchaeia archaeon]|nr:hypothetical protein [Candidatus Nanoarchaeia archaeon]